MGASLTITHTHALAYTGAIILIMSGVTYVMLRLMLATLEETALKDTKLIEAIGKATQNIDTGGETLTESQKEAKSRATVTWGLAIAVIVGLLIVAASVAYYADRRG